MKVGVLESAWRDLREGHTFYEQQEEGVGHYFLDTLCAEIDSLTLYGGIHPVRLGYHRMLSAKFPYAIYYRIDHGDVVVRAVLDCRRDPTWIKEQLK